MDMRVADKVKAIVEKARAESRSPLSALVDLAHSAGHDQAEANLNSCDAWIDANGEPSFDKLLAWGEGYAAGEKDEMKRTKEALNRIAREANLSGLYRETLQAAGCPIVDGCNIVSVLDKWIVDQKRAFVEAYQCILADGYSRQDRGRVINLLQQFAA